ncbi:hypothetical protein I9W82_000276 [Candida metapsilosis]|uniref:Uncharacterized protein n=1 Tax=Candida metapsilosis TaxID=273372 RepID=A0A8H7ZKZ7_9ASCO|nr:hypothetical protein I9W82_000276 [Candida metapsilosis]
MSGALSSRVMNMKFMQKSDSPKLNEDQETQSRRIIDESEWSLPDGARILRMASRKPKTEVLGYGSILGS